MVSPSDRLDGWKAIADYLGRDERTVQRWRKERGMPVHRVPGVKGGTVFAYPGEIERWLLEQSPLHPDLVPPTPEPEPAPTLEPLASADPPRARWIRARRVWLALSGAIVAVVIAVTAALTWRPSVIPERVELRGTRLTALATGEILWEYDVTNVGGAASVNPPIPTGGSAVLQDITGDGEPEVFAQVVYAPAGSGSSHNQFICLSANGRFLWTYRPELDLTFGGTRYNGPWRTPHWTTAPDGKKLALWLAVHHQTWWPSALVRLDSTGQPQIRFVHPGHVYYLAHSQSERGSFIAGTGINNEHAAAMLFILRESDPPAVGPYDQASKYACEKCPPGSPIRYFVFPGSELNRVLHGSYNYGYNIVVTTGGGLEVSLREVTVPELRSIYRIDSDFRLESVAMSDVYWETHRRLEREGRIEHAADECPERHSKEVLDWNPHTGWNKVVVFDPAFRR
jgi:hypothetical protein